MKIVLFSICLTSTRVFLHTLIFLQSCLTGATAESIIQHVSKTPHHISTERKKKKKALYHLQTNLAAGTLLRESVCG